MTEHHQSTRGCPRVALVTCAALPELDPDERLLQVALTARGVAVDTPAWDAPDVDWAGYDLAVIRSTWDYVPRRDEFVAWAASVPRLVNPADVIAWNTDKRYLEALRAAGVPTVSTTWITPGQPWQAPEQGEYVIKPAISAGSMDSGRYDLADPAHRQLAEKHVAGLGAAGRVVMLQPYLHAIDHDGETALMFTSGPAGPAFSHAIRKGAMLTGPAEPSAELYHREQIDPRTATDEQLALAERALAAVPGGADRLLYARVDLVPGPDGTPVLVELELTEPALFLGRSEQAADRFADAVLAHLSR